MYFEADDKPPMNGWGAGFGPRAARRDPCSKSFYFVPKLIFDFYVK